MQCMEKNKVFQSTKVLQYSTRTQKITRTQEKSTIYGTYVDHNFFKNKTGKI